MVVRITCKNADHLTNDTENYTMMTSLRSADREFALISRGFLPFMAVIRQTEVVFCRSPAGRGAVNCYPAALLLKISRLLSPVSAFQQSTIQEALANPNRKWYEHKWS